MKVIKFAQDNGDRAMSLLSKFALEDMSFRRVSPILHFFSFSSSIKRDLLIGVSPILFPHWSCPLIDQGKLKRNREAERMLFFTSLVYLRSPTTRVKLVSKDESVPLLMAIISNGHNTTESIPRIPMASYTMHSGRSVTVKEYCEMRESGHISQSDNSARALLISS